MSVLQDIRLACRLFRRAPAPTCIALLSITLSVGATAVVFAAIQSVLLDPLPYAHAGELVQIGTEFAGADQSHAEWLWFNDAQEIIRRNRTLASAGVYRNAVFDLAVSSKSESRPGLRSRRAAPFGSSAFFRPDIQKEPSYGNRPAMSGRYHQQPRSITLAGDEFEL